LVMAREQAEADAAQLKFRVATDLRLALEAAAKTRGVSLNREITERLSRSLRGEAFDADQYSQEFFYGTRLRGMMVLVATAMQWAGRQDSWFDDPIAYYRAQEAAASILKALAPPGEIKASKRIKQRADLLSKSDGGVGRDVNKLEKDHAQMAAGVTADGIIEDISLGRPGLMIGTQRRVNQMRADLGEQLLDRLGEYAKAHPIGESEKKPA
jgi:hypothetical protein